VAEADHDLSFRVCVFVLACFLFLLICSALSFFSPEEKVFEKTHTVETHPHDADRTYSLSCVILQSHPICMRRRVSN
jgi:hypothetical protein